MVLQMENIESFTQTISSNQAALRHLKVNSAVDLFGTTFI